MNNFRLPRQTFRMANHWFTNTLGIISSVIFILDIRSPVGHGCPGNTLKY